MICALLRCSRFSEKVKLYLQRLVIDRMYVLLMLTGNNGQGLLARSFRLRAAKEAKAGADEFLSAHLRRVRRYQQPLAGPNIRSPSSFFLPLCSNVFLCVFLSLLLFHFLIFVVSALTSSTASINQWLLGSVPVSEIRD